MSENHDSESSSTDEYSYEFEETAYITTQEISMWAHDWRFAIPIQKGQTGQFKMWRDINGAGGKVGDADVGEWTEE